MDDSKLQDSPLSQVRTMLLNAGWVMVGKTSRECWSNGRHSLFLTRDEVTINSPALCVMSIARFLEGGGPKMIG